MTPQRYELLEHAADVMVRCKGETMEECFENSAYAMYDQIVDASKIEHSITRKIEVSGSDDEERLYSFLSELLFITDCESLVFNQFEVSFIDDKVICTAEGEPLDLKRHHAKAEIKAVTYHMLSVNMEEPSVTVIFDV